MEMVYTCTHCDYEDVYNVDDSNETFECPFCRNGVLISSKAW